ncbi:hypothetical protein A2U01_0073916, partial [Trifolium medium]|nr:hypothetical protein [Trifolium medium]
MWMIPRLPPRDDPTILSYSERPPSSVAPPPTPNSLAPFHTLDDTSRSLVAKIFLLQFL